ncbi:hypothetical protein H5410_043392 [Solanum commersonii]|uniref:Uncharacterized protein n=1 Tax=Solanum commersonii TaxID=4109 RepID=A0A9J5Y193_SOLCO|nr:hypothetical protein H5410_043392 [Solanum commersonii]
MTKHRGKSVINAKRDKRAKFSPDQIFSSSLEPLQKFDLIVFLLHKPQSTMAMTVIEVAAPSPMRYMMGAAVMMIGVVLPLAYMMFRNKRVPSSSSYSKQT